MSEYHDCESRGQCDDARDELARLKSAHEWRAIETAPKDGTHVLLRYRWAHREAYVAEGWWLAVAEVWVCHGQPSVRATHWMPLPEPPSP